MTKQELITYISEKTGLNKQMSEDALNATIQGITEALHKGDEVSFVGFGSFSVINKKARDGRNPRTGETIKIAASKAVKFKAGKGLKNIR